MSNEAKLHRNVTDGPVSERHGYNPPVICERSAQYHELRSTGQSDAEARAELGLPASFEIEERATIEHKRKVAAQLEQDAAQAAEAAEARLAAAVGLCDALCGLSGASAKMLEQRMVAACHGSPAATQNVIAVLRAMGLRR